MYAIFQVVKKLQLEFVETGLVKFKSALHWGNIEG
jgi:hypothetical protein